MAAWLAYLKSRLLLPAPPQEEGPSAEEMAAAFARRLRHLERIRRAAAQLMARPQMGRDAFARALPPPSRPLYTVYTATIYDLLSAYARQRQTKALSHVTLKTRTVWSLAEARAAGAAARGGGGGRMDAAGPIPARLHDDARAAGGLRSRRASRPA